MSGNTDGSDFFRYIISAVHTSLNKIDDRYVKVNDNLNKLCNIFSGNVPVYLDEKFDEVVYSSEDNSKVICNICFTNRRNVLYIPCRHMISCNSCSLKMDKKCPYCCQDINEFINVYLP